VADAITRPSTADKATSEWTLWAVAASCAVHVAEEYLTGWQQWAAETLGIGLSSAPFLAMNAVLVILAVVFANIGWRRPALSLIIPAATLINGVFFHIIPTIAQRHVAPGFYSALLLYVPFSSWAYVGAWRDGVRKRSLAIGFVLGTLMMVSVFLAAKWAMRS